MKKIILLFAFLLLLKNLAVAQCTCDRRRDSLALVTLYDSLDGNNWLRKDNWKSAKPINEWYGVSVPPNSLTGCVDNLDLDGGLNFSWSSGLGGNGLKGRLPAAFGNLTCMWRFSFNDNKGLVGTIPSTVGNLKSLSDFWARNCGLSGSFPDAFWTLPNLSEVDLSDNPLNTTLSPRLVDLPKLQGFIAGNCGISGKMPIEWRTAPKLYWVDFYKNALDSLPDFTTFPMSRCTCGGDSGLSVQRNRLTFDDILPNISIKTRTNFYYAPQDSVFRDTTITATIGANFDLDLQFDGALTTNKYRWFKNQKDTTTDGANNHNHLILRGLRLEHAGVYTCEITNDGATELKLFSRKIRLVVDNRIILPPTTTEKAIGLTPNGDGRNDFLVFNEIENTPSIDAEISIVNRYGQVLFRAQPYRNNWAGTNQNGERLPDGAYFFILKIGGETKTGDVVIFSN